MNKDITAALIFLRDLFNRQADDVLLPAEEQLKQAKARHHDAKILSNQLKKRALKVQAMITVEMQAQHDSACEMDNGLEYKTASELKAELITDGDLIEVMKRVPNGSPV